MSADPHCPEPVWQNIYCDGGDYCFSIATQWPEGAAGPKYCERCWKEMTTPTPLESAAEFAMHTLHFALSVTAGNVPAEAVERFRLQAAEAHRRLAATLAATDSSR